jgi:RimJ/RimL family protein N-acetyltransferase
MSAATSARLALQGRHVRLEPLTLDHLDALSEIATGDRSTFDYTPIPIDRASLTTYLEKAGEARREGRQVPFATRRLADDRVVGSTRFYDLETWDWSSSLPGDEAGRSGPGPDVANIGYTWLAPEAQRSPVNSEAKLLMLGHAFEVWHTRVVRIQTDARNERSRRAIERLGCRLDGIIRADRPAADGGVRDTALYSMLAEEWPAARRRLVARLGG